MIRRSLEECLRVWFRAERRRAGDMFATAAELEGILSDPLGHADLLKGRDAYTFVLATLNEEISGFEESLAELGPEVASGELSEAAAVAVASRMADDSLPAESVVPRSAALFVKTCLNPTDARMVTASGWRLCSWCGYWHTDWTKPGPAEKGDR